MLRTKKLCLRGMLPEAALLLVVFVFCLPAIFNASFVADDYRYLHQFRVAGGEFFAALWHGSVVENRWDNDWWIEQGARVLFFRPLVILSFALDRWFYGSNPAGYIGTNILLHCLVTLLVWIGLSKILGKTPAVWLAALAFGLHGCHGANIWYVSGRTDTLGGLFFLASIISYLEFRKSRSRCYLGLTSGLFFLALLAKEYNLLVLPAFVALDYWLPLPGRPVNQIWLRERAGLLIWCGIAGVGYFVLRTLAFSQYSGPSSFPYPYFNLPQYPGFGERTFAVALQYVSSIAIGARVHSFCPDLQYFLERISKIDLSVAIISFVSLMVVSGRRPLGRMFIVFFLVPLLMVIPLYSSSRYLYIPSFGYCGLLALVLSELHASKRVIAQVLLVSVLMVAPAASLWRQLQLLPRIDTASGEDKLIAAVTRIQDDITGTKLVCFVDFPFSWLRNQFLQQIAEESLDRRLPPLRMLTAASQEDEERQTKVIKIDAHTIEISRPGGFLYEPNLRFDLAERRVTSGQVIKERDYEARVLEARNDRAVKLLVRFTVPIETIKFFRFRGRDQIEPLVMAE